MNVAPTNGFDPRVGTLLAGTYYLDRKIGEGGMSTVYLSQKRGTTERVAVKVHAPPKQTGDPVQLLRRAELEGEALASLDHSNVVQVLEHGPTEDGGYYLAMEYVEGTPLNRVLRKTRLDPDRALRLILPLCSALQHAHDRDIVHRDIKASNVLVTTDARGREKIKLIDFGLVKWVGDETASQHGIILGSVHTMAPEQIKHGSIDHRVDQYALGALMFRMLTGRYPFHSRQPTEILAAHLHAEVPAFADIDPELVLPPEMEGIVRRCLAKRPADRYDSMAELMADLESCLKVGREHFVSVIDERTRFVGLDEASEAALSPVQQAGPNYWLLAGVALVAGLAGALLMGMLS